MKKMFDLSELNLDESGRVELGTSELDLIVKQNINGAGGADLLDSNILLTIFCGTENPSSCTNYIACEGDTNGANYTNRQNCDDASNAADCTNRSGCSGGTNNGDCTPP